MNDTEQEPRFCVDCGNTFYPGDANPACATCSTAYADLEAEREKVRVLRGQLRQVLEAADPVDGETLKPDSEILDDINWQSLEAALDATDPETTNPGE